MLSIISRAGLLAPSAAREAAAAGTIFLHCRSSSSSAPWAPWAARCNSSTSTGTHGNEHAGGHGRGLTEEERSRQGATAHAECADDVGLIKHLFDLSGRTAIVTGAAQGMGAWIAMGMAQWGADVALTDMGNEQQLGEVAGICRKMGRKALALKCDVRDMRAVEAAVQEAVDKLGSDNQLVLVANAGILGRLQPADRVSRTVWREVMETNVHGAYHCCRAVYPHMRAGGGGKIIMMSSIAGIRGFGAQVAYCASKGALLPLSKSLAVAWGKDNIQVNCLLPGAINTPFLDAVLNTPEKIEYVLKRIPAGRLGVGKDVVGPALFLASPASDYVTGAELVIDGGGTVLPMLADQDPADYRP